MNQLEYINNKIVKDWSNIKSTLSLWHFKEEKIVFTNGCFDIVHRGHIDYLSKAKDLGSKLIIGLNTDTSVKRLKGDDRPINDEDSRALLLAAFGFADLIILFHEETPYDLIKFIQPDILVKGNDYNPEDIVGYDILKAKGGEIKTLDFLDGFSSTSIIDKIQSLK
jgi:rfaE bifunctional protein nucleotidyltransferase chain/domain